MTARLTVTDSELATIRHILARHLPAGVRVSAFGSRAGGRPKPMSDLDLVLEGETALPLALMARLAEAFDESPLPWKVDLVDRTTVSAAFGALIDAGKITICASRDPDNNNGNPK